MLDTLTEVMLERVDAFTLGEDASSQLACLIHVSWPLGLGRELTKRKDRIDPVGTLEGTCIPVISSA